MQVNAKKLFIEFSKSNKDRLFAEIQCNYITQDMASFQNRHGSKSEDDEAADMAQAASHYAGEQQAATRAMRAIASICEDYYKPYMAVYTMSESVEFLRDEAAPSHPHIAKYLQHFDLDDIKSGLINFLGITKQDYDMAAAALKSDKPPHRSFVDADETTIGEDRYCLHLAAELLTSCMVVKDNREVPTFRVLRGINMLIEQGGFSTTSREYAFCVWHLYISYVDALNSFKITGEKHAMEAYKNALWMVMMVVRGSNLRGFVAQYIYQRSKLRYMDSIPHPSIEEVCSILGVSVSEALLVGEAGAKQAAKMHETQGGIFGLDEFDFDMVLT